MFHVFLLELYHASTILGRGHEPSPLMKIDGEQNYEVEDVFDLRVLNCKLQYFVHWL